MFFRRKSAGVTWLVAFLGNPGGKYAGTRHNVGFLAADALAKEKGIAINRLKFRALTAVCELGGERALLMKPQTYMNLSGDAVSQAAAFYRIPTDHILVVSDDVALPVGRLRIRRGGSAGGHNGLKDIILKCGGEGFPRIRIGVGSPEDPDCDMADWVLSTFPLAERDAVAQAAERAAQAAETLIRDGIDRAMCQYNG